MGATGGPIRVLHVDDEPEFRELAATLLEREDDRFGVESVESAFDFIHPNDQDAAVEAFGALVSEPEATTNTEYRFRNADGEWLWLEVRGRNLLEDPVVGGAVVYARDITDRKRREREIERTNDRVEALASAVSHDLRNPLSVAASHLE